MKRQIDIAKKSKPTPPPAAPPVERALPPVKEPEPEVEALKTTPPPPEQPTPHRHEPSFPQESYHRAPRSSRGSMVPLIFVLILIILGIVLYFLFMTQ